MKEVKKPWGNFKEFIRNKKCTVKILEVNPKQQLSLQYHHKREEMWYFLEEAYAVLGSKKRKYKAGEILKIPRKTNHRLIGGTGRARILEISFGHFSETDIVRLEDSYGRK